MQFNDIIYFTFTAGLFILQYQQFERNSKSEIYSPDKQQLEYQERSRGEEKVEAESKLRVPSPSRRCGLRYIDD